MKITYKGDYALKIILDLSLNYGSRMVQIKDISKRQDIPLKYLEQIVLVLKGAGYIRSKRGPVGGISLAKSPESITLGEIIRLMEGTTAPITCVKRISPSECSYMKHCPFVGVWIKIRDLTNAIVDNTTFAEMVKKYQLLNRKVLDYSI